MIRVESLTEAGGDHPANEDAFVVRQHPQEPTLHVCFLADGQGGRAGGQRAARLACETGIESALRLTPDRLRDKVSWIGLVFEIDRAVAADSDAGFTTLVGFCVGSKRVVGASVGDSAALLVTATETTLLTDRQRKNPPVGAGEPEPVAFETRVELPWKLLAVSDGVWKYVGWERVIATARRNRGRDLIAELERAARLPGSGRFQDDFSAVLLEAERTTQAGGR